MHMADALVSAAVGVGMCAVSAGAVGFGINRLGKGEAAEKKVPLMAVCGAFVFAAQMINFTIPGTGSSGHIGGGMLLAAMLGGPAALLTISSVLIIQCLFFADGGLLALGCNIFNMGVIPCLLVYPLIYRPLAKRPGARRIALAAFISAVAALQLGAFAVVLETLLSGITELPFGAFAALMQPIHLAIGAVEGVITAAVLCFVYMARPELFDERAEGAKAGGVIIALGAAALIIGGGLSLFASGAPDGLEWAIGHAAQAEPEPKGLAAGAAEAQAAVAVMPDYDFKSGGGGTTAAGIAGGALTFALAGGAALVITKLRRKAVE